MQVWLATHNQAAARCSDDNFNFDVSKYFQFEQLEEPESAE